MLLLEILPACLLMRRVCIGLITLVIGSLSFFSMASAVDKDPFILIPEAKDQ